MEIPCPKGVLHGHVKDTNSCPMFAPYFHPQWHTAITHVGHEPLHRDVWCYIEITKEIRTIRTRGGNMVRRAFLFVLMCICIESIEVPWRLTCIHSRRVFARERETATPRDNYGRKQRQIDTDVWLISLLPIICIIERNHFPNAFRFTLTL